MSAILAVDIPNPLGPIADGIGGLVGAGARRAGEAVLSTVGDAILKALASACEKVSEELLHFLGASSSVHFDQGWWASDRGERLVRTIGALAGVFLVGFLLLALIQGLLAGDPGAMVRAAVLETPISVAATVVLAAVAQLLLGVADESSNLVLDRVPEDLARFFAGFGDAASVATHGFAGVVMLVVFLFGALLVWVELVVRASLIYWLAAAAPLLAAARVWPAARGAFRKLCEIGVALIFSKLAISIALGLGAAALAGGGPREGDLGTKVGLDLAGLLTGAALMLLAAFTPFVLLRLLPIVEVAVAAQGISRSPARAGQAGMQAAYYAEGLMRMAGGGHGRSSLDGGLGGRAGAPGGWGPTGPGGGPGPAGAGGGGGAGASTIAGGASGALPVGVGAGVAAAVGRTAHASASAAAPNPGAGPTATPPASRPAPAATGARR